MEERKTLKTNRMMSIREVASTGIIPEHALRILVREKRIPFVKIGTKVLVNYEVLSELLKGNL